MLLLVVNVEIAVNDFPSWVSDPTFSSDFCATFSEVFTFELMEEVSELIVLMSIFSETDFLLTLSFLLISPVLSKVDVLPVDALVFLSLAMKSSAEIFLSLLLTVSWNKLELVMLLLMLVMLMLVLFTLSNFCITSLAVTDVS